MSQVIDVCEWDSGDTASVPSLSLSRKRPWDIEKQPSNDVYSCYENGHGNKNATGSAEFVVDLELADEAEVSVSPHIRKRRGVVKSGRSVEIDGVGKCVKILKGVPAPEKDVDSEDSEQTCLDDGSATKRSRKLSTSKASSNASGQQWRASAWDDLLSELADYRKIHGHCNVPQRYSENTKLAKWVKHQRTHCRFHLEGKASPMTLSRIQELESLGFEWKPSISRRKLTPKKSNLDDDDVTRVREGSWSHQSMCKSTASRRDHK
jgi:hypothetical protein